MTNNQKNTKKEASKASGDFNAKADDNNAKDKPKAPKGNNVPPYRFSCAYGRRG